MDKNDFFCVGTKEEMENFERKLDFGDEIGDIYEMLSPEHKICVNHVLDELTGDTDFFGYNFDKVLKGFKDVSPKLSQLLISQTLSDDVVNYLSEEDCDKFFDSFKSGMEINHQLDNGKKTITLKEDTLLYQYVRVICDYFQVDMELFTQGSGAFYTLTDKWGAEFSADTEFLGKINEEIDTRWNTRLCCKEYEKYLIEQGRLKEGETILEESWAVVTYSGKYRILKQQKGKRNELNAVQTLIKELHALSIR